MSKRNSVTTNTKRQMQGATTHRHWLSSQAHIDWQRACAWHGVNSREAAQMLHIGTVQQVQHTTPQKPAMPRQRPAVDTFYQDLASFFNGKRQAQGART